MKTCPNCGNSYDDQLDSCPYCQSDAPPPSKAGRVGRALGKALFITVVLIIIVAVVLLSDSIIAWIGQLF
ncbi:hypothetical protein [Solibaculum mannosilyticum]|uniref:Zinc ribbon domain-containing protein n=1 Tax=Solibaculum mannosilyticum TaxID=2780922 RepID=A0A7I8D1J1_9FIRM|nr:hypothetical protein [Solibaculum mannosilyticum]BCI60670.1 hypothetical protein C12CBH8_13090 [Solibaculum mannosilyticum]CZT57750.1 hypothetical protein BN3661_02158 [Eubacteriaceae bacterium CHKCI005]